MDDQKLCSSTVSCLTVVRDANCQGFHIVMIEGDASFTNELPLIGFGQILMDEVRRLATLHQARIVHPNIETFNGSEETAPQGFSLVALIGESSCRLSIYCNFDQGTLTVDYFNSAADCGDTDGTAAQKVAGDVVVFLKLQLLPADAQFLVNHLSWFPDGGTKI